MNTNNIQPQFPQEQSRLHRPISLIFAGAVAALLIVTLILVYLLSRSPLQESAVNDNAELATSDELSSIEEDLQNQDFDSYESDMAQLEAELNAAFE